ncbi:MAG: hypothetical protein ACFFDT_07790 [Candidatus Hodarchaeota archaeon]
MAELERMRSNRALDKIMAILLGSLSTPLHRNIARHYFDDGRERIRYIIRENRETLLKALEEV